MSRFKKLSVVLGLAVALVGVEGAFAIVSADDGPGVKTGSYYGCVYKAAKPNAYTTCSVCYKIRGQARYYKDGGYHLTSVYSRYVTPYSPSSPQVILPVIIDVSKYVPAGGVGVWVRAGGYVIHIPGINPLSPMTDWSTG